jgi:hypothetical protein
MQRELKQRGDPYQAHKTCGSGIEMILCQTLGHYSRLEIVRYALIVRFRWDLSDMTPVSVKQ